MSPSKVVNLLPLILRKYEIRTYVFEEYCIDEIADIDYCEELGQGITLFFYSKDKAFNAIWLWDDDICIRYKTGVSRRRNFPYHTTIKTLSTPNTQFYQYNTLSKKITKLHSFYSR